MTRTALLAASRLFAVFAATPAFAQDDAAPASAPEADQIIVTAQLREQNLLEVPAAVTAYEGEFLEELGLREFEDVSRYVPGFDVQNQSPNNPGFVMRGITSDSGEAFVEPRVSVYQDGVSIAKARGSYVELFDVQRIEVVRGPQSTLYGRGALIGAVNLIQNRADPDNLEVLVRGAYGNYDFQLYEGMVNLPLSDQAALRFAGRIRDRQGYTENLLGGRDFNGVETQAARAALHAEAGERFTLDLFGNYQIDNPPGTGFQALNFRPTDPATGAVLGPIGNQSGALAASAGFPEGDLGLDREVYGVTAIARYEFSDALALTSISAWREFNSLEVFDADGISLPVLTAAEDAQGQQYSQELRLSYDDGGLFSGFIGASYFNDENSQRTPAQFDERLILARLTGTLNGGPLQPGRPATDPAPLGLFGATAFTARLLQGVAAARGVALAAPLAAGIAANLRPNQLETLTNFSETEAFDIFADATFRISPQFEVGAGIRYSRDDKTTAFSSAVLNGRSILGGFIGALGLPAAQRTPLLTALAAPGAATIPTSAAFPVPIFGLGFQPTAGNGSIVSRQLDDEGITYRVTARWMPSDRTSIYATYARGRRPEVLTVGSPSVPFGAPNFDVVAAETVDSVEIGARHQMGRTLYLDAALFYQKYENFQTVVQQGTEFITTNAGEAEGYGVELQARWRPIPPLQVFGTYAYNHNRFGNGIFEDNRFRLSPDHAASLGARLEAPIGPGTLDFTPSVTYQSEVFFDNDNDIPALQTGIIPDLVQDEFQDEYVLVNARLGYTFNDPRDRFVFRLEAFVTNLFDEDYIKDAGNTGDGIGLPTFIAGEPQMYGVEASVRF